MDNRRRMLLSGGLSADPVLENNDWETISKVARAGKAAEFWKVGDLKNINIGGVTYAAQIIGFDHDDVTDPAAYGRAKAGITFQLQNCLNTKYKFHTTASIVGWGDCSMRTSTLAGIYNNFSTDNPELYSAIVPVDKIVQNNTAGAYTYSDTLFLLSEYEVMGTVTYATAAEGSQYAYYAAGNSYSKNVDGIATTWWERTRQKGKTYYFTLVSPTTGYYFAAANSNYGVAFAFCV